MTIDLESAMSALVSALQSPEFIHAYNERYAHQFLHQPREQRLADTSLDRQIEYLGGERNCAQLFALSYLLRGGK